MSVYEQASILVVKTVTCARCGATGQCTGIGPFILPVGWDSWRDRGSDDLEFVHLCAACIAHDGRDRGPVETTRLRATLREMMRRCPACDPADADTVEPGLLPSLIRSHGGEVEI